MGGTGVVDLEETSFSLTSVGRQWLQTLGLLGRKTGPRCPPKEGVVPVGFGFAFGSSLRSAYFPVYVRYTSASSLFQQLGDSTSTKS